MVLWQGLEREEMAHAVPQGLTDGTEALKLYHWKVGKSHLHLHRNVLMSNRQVLGNRASAGHGLSFGWREKTALRAWDSELKVPA